MGYVSASEIQEKAIPSLLEGKDVIGQAQTGTGKTAAFSIPGITKVDPDNNKPQFLVLCPTRELVVQVTGELKKLTKYQQNVISVLAIYGGQDISIQLKALKKGAAQIIVATPGRIMDHMRRGSVKFDQLKYLVFDEADQMLDMGFREDMETILAETPKERQTVMFSATIPKDLMALMKRFQKDPIHINTIGNSTQAKQINQLYFHINNASKLEALKRLLTFHNISNALIFCNTKMKVDELAKELNAKKYTTASLHGDIDQKKRDRVMKEFRQGKIQLLIATDVAARGLDVDDLEAVVNYDLPRFDQDYVHRIGRTGRAGKAGLALTFCAGREVDHIQRIARKTNMTIEQSKIPDARDMEKTNFESVKALVHSANFDRKELDKYSKYVDSLEIFDFSKEELTAVLIKTLIDQESDSLSNGVSFEPERSGGGRRSDNNGRSGGGRSSGGRSGGGGSFGKRPSGKFGNRSSSGRSGSGSRSGSSSSGGGSRSSESSNRDENNGKPQTPTKRGFAHSSKSYKKKAKY